MSDDEHHDTSGSHSDHGGEAHGSDEHEGENPVGKIASGTGDVLEGAAGLVPFVDEDHDGVEDEGTARDVRTALETAAEGAEAVEEAAAFGSDMAGSARGFSSGDGVEGASELASGVGNLGDGAGAVFDAGARALEHENEEVAEGLREAGRVARDVGKIAKGVGEIIEGAGELAEMLGGREHVPYQLRVEGQDTPFTVRSVHLYEGLGQLSEGTIEATFPLSAHLEDEELLSKDVELEIARGEQQRHFRGIVRHASIRRVHDHHVLHLDVVPAMWLLTEITDSPIYQGLTVPELVSQVMREHLGDVERAVCPADPRGPAGQRQRRRTRRTSRTSGQRSIRSRTCATCSAL